MAKFAEGTTVSTSTSREEVERLLKRAGATNFYCGEADDRVILGCKMEGRLLKFIIPLPTEESAPRGSNQPHRREPWSAQEMRRRWRCLVLQIKAKLSAIETGATTAEEEFLANVVMADNRTVYEHVRDGIEDSYATGKVRGPLMLGPAT